MPNIEDMASVLKELFGDVSMHVEPAEGYGDHSAIRAEVETTVGRLRLWIMWLETVSRARLVDAVEIVRLSDQSDMWSLDVISAPYLSAAQQRLLREADVPFFDLAGNARIVTHGLHVDRRGFRSQHSEQRSTRDLFSDKASLVPRVLLSATKPLGVRQIAQMGKLTPGYVSKVASEMERRGYLARSTQGLSLRHADELLRDWVVEYRKRRQRSQRSYFLAGNEARVSMPDLAAAFDRNGVEYLFGGMAGASLVDPYAEFDVVDVMLKDHGDGEAMLRNLGAREVDRGGNVKIVVPYYRVSGFYDWQRVAGDMRVASDIQLYLDTFHYPVRGREQAEHLYERRILPQLEGHRQ